METDPEPAPMSQTTLDGVSDNLARLIALTSSLVIRCPAVGWANWSSALPEYRVCYRTCTALTLSRSRMTTLSGAHSVPLRPFRSVTGCSLHRYPDSGRHRSDNYRCHVPTIRWQPGHGVCLSSVKRPIF